MTETGIILRDTNKLYVARKGYVLDYTMSLNAAEIYSNTKRSQPFYKRIIVKLTLL